MTLAPFDTLAPTYDVDFTEHPLGRWLRKAVWTYLEPTFAPGDHVLELGCGTGEDAVWLARRGLFVHATDQSPAMLDVAQRKAILQGVADRITCTPLDLASPSLPKMPAPLYNGCLSNFGALNCLADRRVLAQTLAQWIRPGGKAVFVIMGPFCPWEWGWYLAHGRVRTAFRRFRPGTEARLDEASTMRVWYPSPRRLRSEFAPYFRMRKLAGIGVVLPPSFASRLVDRHPRFFARLVPLDRRLGRFFPGTWFNDHYLMILERTKKPVRVHPLS